MNKAKVYKCPKCECNQIFIKPSAKRFGIFCKECDSLIKWISYEKAKELMEQNTNETIGEQYAIRRIKKKDNFTIIRCSKCNALLFNSAFPKVKGQFDLVRAKFCPKCGKELI